MKIKWISITLFALGILYMLIDGWLVSWWLVPDYREAGPSFVNDNSLYTSGIFFTFWALSVPLGSLITAAALALYSSLEKKRFLIFIFGSILFLLWLGFWSHSVLYPLIYGIGGGIILFSFCISIWSLAKIRRHNRKIPVNILDFRALAYIFFVITAWGLCGLLGIPSFGLRPVQLMEFGTQNMMLNMSAKILICFSFGWIFLGLSQYSEYRYYKHTAEF